MSTKIILTATGTNNWTVPVDWNNAANSIEVIGAGGDGGTGGFNAGAGGGGGGGYGKITNQTLTPGASISYTIANHGSAGDTYWNGASYAAAPVAAHGGTNGTGLAKGIGAAGKGTVNYSGGDGYWITGSTAGGGGGGAAGLNGNGQLAQINTVGGAGDNGSGGAGGANASAGGNGTEYTTVGSGGGGGGGAYPYGPSGNAGLYGAGGGGGSGNNISGYTPGLGSQGLIVITYLSVGPRYWVGGTGNWDASTTTHWSATSGGTGGASVPTAVNSVFFDLNSGSGVVTTTASQSVINIDMTGSTITTLLVGTSVTCAGNFILGSGIELYVNTGQTITIAGDLTVITGGIISHAGNITLGGNLTIGTSSTLVNTGTLTFNSTSSGKTITTNGSQLECSVTFNGIGGAWTLQDYTNIGFGKSLTITNGTVTLGAGIDVYSISNAGTFNLSSYGVRLYGIGTVWSNTGTINAGTSTLALSEYSATSSSKIFAGGGAAYNNIYLTNNGTGVFVIQGNNTFNDFKCDTPPHTIQFTAGSTQTLNTFTVNGTAGNLMTLQSTSAGSPWYLVKNPAGVVSCDYLSIQDSHVS